jgi:phage terminase large subunit
LIKINNKYTSFAESDSRYFVITGGRGSGKSYAISTLLLSLTFEPNQKILFTRYTMTSAHISIIPEFLDKIDTLGVANRFTITKNEIVNNQTGSSILFKGIKTGSGDQTASLKSLQGITSWVLDEAEELNDETIFDKINFSIRQKGQQNRVILILNPATKEHFIYKRFFESENVKEGFNGTKNNTTYIHTTYLDNKDYLDESFLYEVERVKETNPTKYNHVILGSWLDKAEGVVFSNWEYGTFNPDGLQSSFGMDFGFKIDPNTLVEVAIDKKKKIIYVKECLYKTGLTTSELAHIIKSNAARKLVIADSAEPRLINELCSQGCNVVPTEKGAGSITAGVALMLDYKIVVDGVNIGKELNNFIYADKGSSLFVDNYNHAIDAIRYNIFYHLSGSGGIEIR